MNPTFGSLFAGVGGFDLGFEQAGFDCKFQVEWDDNCQQTLAHHWPNVPRWGDVSEVNGADLPPVDVITYGFPCQDLSVAGKRAGLDGERSNLFFQAIRIIQEMRQATNGQYPTFAVAENVAGLLNADKGDAMARVLDTLAEAGALVIEWCMLDAQWFGVPQRRRRVFVTACFDPATADRCPDQIFPVAKSGSRNPAEVEQERQEVAGTLGGGSGERGWSPDTDRMTFIPMLENELQKVTGTLAAGAHPGSYNGQDAYSDMLIPYSVGPLTTGSPQGIRGTETSDSGHIIAFSHTQGLDPQPSQHHFPTLRSEGGGQAVAQTNLAVRRLTPTECERLMGWPDNHTLPRTDGKDNSDSTRYRMCGNGVVAPVATWIAKHLKPLL